MSMENPFQNVQPSSAEAASPAEGEVHFTPDSADIEREAERIWYAEFEGIGEDDPQYHSVEEVREALQAGVEEFGWPDDSKTIDTGLRTPVALAYQRNLYNVG